MLQEFKKFAMRGNVVDMAVGIIIGAAFSKIVQTFVNGVLMPPIGLLMGGLDLSEFTYVIQEKTAETAAVTIKYGLMINHIVDFLIVAFAIFIVIKQMNKLTGSDDEEPTEKDCPECYSTINIKALRCPHCTAKIPAE